MIRTLALAAAAAVTATQAFAWGTHVEGPDVFGVTTVIALDEAARDSLVVQCDSKDQLVIAMISRKKEFEETPVSPATLLIQVDGATPVILEAVLREWNDNYAGVIATAGRSPDLIAVVKAIQSGKSKINAGVDISGNRIQPRSALEGRPLP